MGTDVGRWTHVARSVACIDVLVAPAAGAPMQAQMPETDALREQAEQEDNAVE